MDQACHWYIPLWRWLLLTISGLYKQIPNHLQADLNDSTTCGWTFKSYLLWGWLARHHCIRQWPMLHCWSFHQDHARIQGKPYHQFTHYPQSNGLAEKFVQTVKSLFYKAREEGADLYKVLMIYQSTPLTSNMQSPMQILQNRTARSQLPMSNSARRQLGLDTEKLRIKMKNENLPSHDLHLGQDVMMQDHASKMWSPAVITRLCMEPRSYQVTTRDNVTYRKAQAHLKPYKTEFKNVQDAKSCNMWPPEKNLW